MWYWHTCPPARRLSALSVFLYKSGLCGAFVWARRALNRQKYGDLRPGQSTQSRAVATIKSSQQITVYLVRAGASLSV